MAPKAAEKKAVPKKAVAYVQKQIDSSRYLRKVSPLSLDNSLHLGVAMAQLMASTILTFNFLARVPRADQ